MRISSELVSSNWKGAVRIAAGVAFAAAISMSMTSGAQAAHHTGPKVVDQVNHYFYCLSILGTPQHAIDCSPSNNSPITNSILTGVGGGISDPGCHGWCCRWRPMAL